MELLDYVTGEIITSFPLVKSGSTILGWALSAKAILRATRRGQRFGLSLANHTTLATGLL